MYLSSLTAPRVNLTHNLWERRWVSNGNLNNLSSGSPFSDHANVDDFTLLFCRGRLRNVNSFKTHVLSYCFLLSRSRRRRRRGLLKVLIINYSSRKLRQSHILYSDESHPNHVSNYLINIFFYHQWHKKLIILSLTCWNVLKTFIKSLVKVIHIFVVLYLIRNLWILPKSRKGLVFVSCFRDFSGQTKLNMMSGKTLTGQDFKGKKEIVHEREKKLTKKYELN